MLFFLLNSILCSAATDALISSSLKFDLTHDDNESCYELFYLSTALYSLSICRDISIKDTILRRILGMLNQNGSTHLEFSKDLFLKHNLEIHFKDLIANRSLQSLEIKINDLNSIVKRNFENIMQYKVPDDKYKEINPLWSTYNDVYVQVYQFKVERKNELFSLYGNSKKGTADSQQIIKVAHENEDNIKYAENLTKIFVNNTGDVVENLRNQLKMKNHKFRLIFDPNSQFTVLFGKSKVENPICTDKSLKYVDSLKKKVVSVQIINSDNSDSIEELEIFNETVDIHEQDQLNCGSIGYAKNSVELDKSFEIVFELNKSDDVKSEIEEPNTEQTNTDEPVVVEREQPSVVEREDEIEYKEFLDGIKNNSLVYKREHLIGNALELKNSNVSLSSLGLQLRNPKEEIDSKGSIIIAHENVSIPNPEVSEFSNVQLTTVLEQGVLSENFEVKSKKGKKKGLFCCFG